MYLSSRHFMNLNIIISARLSPDEKIILSYAIDALVCHDVVICYSILVSTERWKSKNPTIFFW